MSCCFNADYNREISESRDSSGDRYFFRSNTNDLKNERSFAIRSDAKYPQELHSLLGELEERRCL